MKISLIFLFFVFVVFSQADAGVLCSVALNSEAVGNGQAPLSFFNRDEYKRQYKKEKLPVNLVISLKQQRKLIKNLNESQRAMVFGRYSSYRVYRNMEIVGAYRGSATRVKISLIEEVKGDHQSVIQLVNADPRTQKGALLIARGIDQAEGKMEHRLLARAVREVISSGRSEFRD